MEKKTVQLGEGSIKLLNLAHAKIIRNNPNNKRPSDETVIRTCIKNYLGETNERTTN